jgi:hypothetical protein
MPQKNYLLGGIVLCIFPVMVLIVVQLDQKPLPLEILVFFALLFISGIWAVVSSVFQLDGDGAAYWFVGSVLAAGFALLALLVALHSKTGWSSNIPFLSDTTNSAVPRILFALGGGGSLLLAVAFFRKAVRKCRKGKR